MIHVKYHPSLGEWEATLPVAPLFFTGAGDTPEEAMEDLMRRIPELWRIYQAERLDKPPPLAQE